MNPHLPPSNTSNESPTYGGGGCLEASSKTKKRSQSLIQKSPVYLPGSLGNRDVMRRLTGLLRPVMTAANCSEPSPLDPTRIRRQQVRSYVRMRPLSTSTSGPTTESLSDLEKSRKWIKVNGSSVVQVTPPSAAITSLSGQPRLPSRDIEFQFRHVLTEDMTQSEVFRMVSGPAIDQLLHGGCGLILCTGAAASGKTYTMIGNDKDESEWGLLKRTFEAIFNCVDKDLAECNLIQPGAANTFIMMAQIGVFGKVSAEPSSESPMPRKLESGFCKFHSLGIWQMRSGKHIVSQKRRYACFISMLEVFGTMVHDLLDDNIGERSPPLFILEDEMGRAYASEANRLEIRNASQAMQILHTGLKRRESLGGKSHLIVNIHLAHVNYNRQLSSYELVGGQDKIQWGQLTLVDMLSPRSGDIDAREYDNVTQMILSLGSCLATLRTNQQAILKGKALKRSPSCRDARLSQLLKHYFDVAQPATVVCISSITQQVEDIHENMRALKLADNIREIIRPRVAESTLPPAATEDTQLPTSPPITAPSKGKVSFPTTIAANRPEKPLPFMSHAGPGRFITKSFMLDYDAIVGTPPLQMPSFDQLSDLCDLLGSLMRRRSDLICHTESKWSEMEMSRILTLASSNAFRDQLREIAMAQKSAIEILKECIQETDYCITEFKRIFETSRYQEFCTALLMPVEKRSQLVENLLMAHNEQMEHYAAMMTSKTKNSKDFNNKMNCNHRPQAGSSALARPKWRQRAISAGDPKGRTPDEAAKAKLLEQRSIRSSATLMRMGVWRY
ncbi:kinesin-like protein KIF20A [Drosophila willistoni]|uniref:kinesin-like protein KIF20A n=1 Tax=Drosophila willistoni TaxID=7260 RepID=UPI000C26CE35|nr:kinesin-like protein KIF20A [Drosophila willistoni]